MKSTTKKQASPKQIQVRDGRTWITVCTRSGRDIETALRRLAKAGWTARAH